MHQWQSNLLDIVSPVILGGIGAAVTYWILNPTSRKSAANFLPLEADELSKPQRSQADRHGQATDPIQHPQRSLPTHPSTEMALGKRMPPLTSPEAILHSMVAAVSRIRLHANREVESEYFSPNCQQILGYSPQEFFADPTLWHSRLVDDDWNSLIHRAFGETLGGTPPAIQSATLEYRFRHSDGTIRWIYSSITAEWDEVTHSWVLTSVGVDISDRKRTELSLRQAKEVAEAANYAKSTFLTNVSHELRTPLNAILGFAELLYMDVCINPGQQEQLDIILRSGEHLLELINDVLEISKIDVGQITLNETCVDLPQLLSSVERMLRFWAEAKGLKFQLNAVPKIAHFIQTDERKLRQILINLLSNAVKFTEVGHVILRISVEAETKTQEPGSDGWLDQPTAMLHFEIEDTGPGIAAPELERLFKPFAQTEAGRQLQQGTGLGLAISQRYAKLMGGMITVTSELARGTTFRLSIPMRPVSMNAKSLAPVAQQVESLALKQPSYRILVVEDQASSRNLVMKLLTKAGFEVREAIDGQEAIALWESWAPHLILMDMQIPVMDGYKATRQIREREQRLKEPLNLGGNGIEERDDPHVKIVAMTASVFEEQRLPIFAAGCDDAVYKPFKAQELYAAIAKHLGVQYVHAESKGWKSASYLSATMQPLTSAHLEVMPEVWRAKLHYVATRLNSEQCLELIQQIPPQHALLSRDLTELVNNFRFDIILHITPQGHNA